MANSNNSYGTNRRRFIKSSLIGGISISFIPFLSNCASDKLTYKLALDAPTKLFDGKRCWTHPRAGIVPGKGTNGNARVIMTMNNLDLAGSDVFYGMFELYTNDLSKNWSAPKELKSLAPRYEIINGVNSPLAVSDFWPKWHTASKTLLGTGHTVAYTPEWKVAKPRPRNTAYATYDEQTNTWRDWQKLEMPENDKFFNAGAGCAQRYDDKNGEILLPIYFSPKGKNSRVTICKCTFDGKKLLYHSHGTELKIDDETRGLGEPSLTKFKENYFLTIRNDKKGFVARSTDGQHFENYKPWAFDDGTELGSYNTQQHWVSHSEALFLVYTRKGVNNDHVFRHRAPLFMAEVDPKRLCVLRETEQIIVPERGARLGNFGVTAISAYETWVTVSEWMQPEGVAKHGSDGSVFVAKIKWNKKNKYFFEG